MLLQKETISYILQWTKPYNITLLHFLDKNIVFNKKGCSNIHHHYRLGPHCIDILLNHNNYDTYQASHPTRIGCHIEEIMGQFTIKIIKPSLISDLRYFYVGRVVVKHIVPLLLSFLLLLLLQLLLFQIDEK